MKKRIGITGARGVLGRHVVFTAPHYEWHSYGGDVTDAGALLRWARETPKLDAMLYLAAIVNVARAKANPAEAMQVKQAAHYFSCHGKKAPVH